MDIEDEKAEGCFVETVTKHLVSDEKDEHIPKNLNKKLWKIIVTRESQPKKLSKGFEYRQEHG